MPENKPPDHLEAVYTAASAQWIHAEQMRWTILYNFLVGNTILLVAWSTLFVAVVSDTTGSVSLKVVSIGFCIVGFAGSVVWIFLELRSNRFAEQYFQAGLKLEQLLLLPQNVSEPLGPFCVAGQHRSGGVVKTHRVVVTVPIVFAGIYLALLMVSIYAAAGRL